MTAIGGPGHGFYGASMPSIGLDMLAGQGIPRLHRLVPACRGDAPAIGRPRYRCHSISMPLIGEEVPAGGGIPHLHRSIPTARGNALAIARPPHRLHTSCMTTKRLHIAPMTGTPTRGPRPLAPHLPLFRGGAPAIGGPRRRCPDHGRPLGGGGGGGGKESVHPPDSPPRHGSSQHPQTDQHLSSPNAAARRGKRAGSR